MASVLNEGAEGNCRAFETNDLETCGASGSEGVSSFEVIRSKRFYALLLGLLQSIAS